MTLCTCSTSNLRTVMSRIWTSCTSSTRRELSRLRSYRVKCSRRWAVLVVLTTNICSRKLIRAILISSRELWIVYRTTSVCSETKVASLRDQTVQIHSPSISSNPEISTLNSILNSQVKFQTTTNLIPKPLRICNSCTAILEARSRSHHSKKPANTSRGWATLATKGKTMKDHLLMMMETSLPRLTAWTVHKDFTVIRSKILMERSKLMNEW